MADVAGAIDRDPRCRVVAIADTIVERAQEAADEFTIPVVAAESRDLLRRDDLGIAEVAALAASAAGVLLGTAITFT